MVKGANAGLSSLGTTIFEVMSGLARDHGAVNLGQGTPEGLEPPDVIAEAARAMAAGPHQYPPMLGLPELRQAIAAHDREWYGLELDWQREILITSGATGALADCLFGLIEPGDEVVVLEPAYDSYLPIIRRAGGIPRLVRLAPPLWELPREALRAAFSAKTKLILINSPMNPCAKVFSRAEQDFIAGLLEEFDAYAVCDEVYEHLVYDGLAHVPLISLPGLRERCVRIGSFGKIFSLTSWKVGYIAAAPALLAPIAKTHQFITFTTPTALQAAVAWGLRHSGDYMRHLPGQLAARRDRLSSGLARLGFAPGRADGTYFLTADFSAFGFNGDDAAFCTELVSRGGVATVPISAFYERRADADAPASTIRFCFAKTEAAIDDALARLEGFLGGRAGV